VDKKDEGLPTERNQEGTADRSEPPVRSTDASGSVSFLQDFATMQRSLVSIDFSVTQVAQHTLKQAGVFEGIIEAQETIAKSFARLIDFPDIAATCKAIVDTGISTQAMAVQKQWAETLAKSIDLSALSSVRSLSAKLNESLRQQTKLFERITDGFTLGFSTIDWAGPVSVLGRCLPANLHNIADLNVIASIASIALDEGIPLSWLPRGEIIALLIEANGSSARLAILSDRRNEILDDCAEVLAPIACEWAVQCRRAIDAMRAGLDEPAQSHASNIIDSIVCIFHRKKGRKYVQTQAQKDFNELSLGLVAENLSLRPLPRAFTPWYPNAGINLPEHFARHATAHAVGYPGVFTPISALIAVMLATSLTVQYSRDYPTTDETESSPFV